MSAEARQEPRPWAVEDGGDGAPDGGGRGSGVTMRALVAGVLVLWQLGMIVYARFDLGRYFTWSPHDVVWTFDLVVETPTETLDHDGAVARYRLRRYRRQEHAVEHVKRAVRQYERTHGRDDGARVTMTYDKNGRDPLVWTWPDETLVPTEAGPGARPEAPERGPDPKTSPDDSGEDAGGGR